MLKNTHGTTQWPANTSGILMEQKQLQYTTQAIVHVRSSQSASSPTRIIAYLPKTIESRPGDRVTITQRPSPLSLNNHFHRQLMRSGIYYQANVDAKNIQHSSGPNMKSTLQKKIIERTRNLFKENTASFLLALYLGNKNYIDKKNLYAYKRSGTMHLLAASGLHVGIIAGLLSFIFRLIFCNKKLLTIMTSLILFFYLYITEQPVSLLRACIMYWLYAIQVLFGIETDTRNTLFLSALIILLLYPYQLYALGFHLSFGATYGIACFYTTYLRLLPKIPYTITESMALTCAAQLMVMPLLALQLNEFHCAAIITNLIAIILVTIPLLLSLCAQLAYVLSASWSTFFSWSTTTSLEISQSCNRFAAALPGHVLLQSNKDFYFFIASYLMYLLPLVIPYKKKYRKSITTVLIICSILLALHPNTIIPPYSSRQLILLKNNPDVFLFKDKAAYTLYGSLRDKKDYAAIRKQLSRSNITALTLFITSEKAAALHYYGELVRTFPVTSCIITTTTRISFRMKRLFRMLEIDKIPLHVIDIDKQTNIRYNKEIKEIIKWHHQYTKRYYTQKEQPVLQKSGSIRIHYI